MEKKPINVVKPLNGTMTVLKQCMPQNITTLSIIFLVIFQNSWKHIHYSFKKKSSIYVNTS
jgi:hypothetical protein